MTARNLRRAPLALIALLAAGCATSAEWATWRGHPTHFASDDHWSFSIRNLEDSEPHVTRDDLSVARREGWWGDPVTVSQNQIVDR